MTTTSVPGRPRSTEVTAGRRPGPGPVDAAGRRLHRRRLRPAPGRGGVLLERGHPLQHPPRQAGHAAAKDGVRLAGAVPAHLQHHHRVRRHRHGPRGHAGLAGQPGGDRRLGRAGDARRAPRRPGRHRRLRQVAARDADGLRPPGPAGGVRLRRHHPARPLPRPRRDRPGHVRGRRGGGRRDHVRGGPGRAGAGGLPGRRVVRRHVHRQHHVGGGRGHRHGPARLGHPAGGVRAPGRGGPPDRRGRGQPARASTSGRARS